MRHIILNILFYLSIQSFAIAQNKANSSSLIHHNSIEFDFGKSEIKASEFGKLEEFRKLLQTDFSGYIQMIGHTDAIGNQEDNIALSQKRNQSIIRYLQKDIKSEIYFITDAVGENHPVSDNDSQSGRQKNRRVELSLYKKTKKEKINPIVFAEREKAIENGTLLEFIIKDNMTDSLIYAKILSPLDDKEYATYEPGKCDIWYEMEETKKMNFEFSAKGYFNESRSFTIQANEENKIIVELTPIREGAVLNLKKVLFAGGKTVLLKSSVPELKRLLKTLQDNTDFTFEIGGHVNIRYIKATKDRPAIKKFAGADLSEARAKKIFKYLSRNGIAEERMTFKGYGNSKMPFPYAKTDQEQAANRRVEIKVVSVSPNSAFTQNISKN